MKKQAYTIIALLILIGSTAVAAKAQTNGRFSLVANIPFEFGVGNKTLPAGEYSISQVNPASDLVVLRITSKDGSATVMIQMDPKINTARESTKLVFHRYGNRYFFAEAWIDGDDAGLKAPQSRAERMAAKELAGLEMGAETVALRSR